MEREPTLYLEDILESLRQIEKYTAALSEETFRDDILVQDAVLRRLEIIGEAVKKLPPSVRERYPDVPWRQVAGTRDVLIHGYFAVDINLTWATIKKHLPLFKKQIKQIVLDVKPGGRSTPD